MGRRRGFTLIELLVVIAIIAILAAMLFPVFAVACESARKIQCLANVKNIATAFQMYLTDYDRFPPKEHNAEAIYWVPAANGNSPGSDCGDVDNCNPYLRWPVVLDEYVKNRDVWRCPSASWLESHFIAFDPGGSHGWLWWEVNHPWSGWNGSTFQYACYAYYPSGWGGSITDSATQFQFANSGLQTESGNAYSATQGAFEGSIGTTEPLNYEMKMSQVDDPSYFVVCGDATVTTQIGSPMRMVYTACHLWGCGSDWVNCSFSQQCGVDAPHLKQWWTDVSFRRTRTRHLGGSNIGFADGHAAWWNADAFLAESPHQDCATGSWHDGKMAGIGSYNNVVNCPDW